MAPSASLRAVTVPGDRGVEVAHALGRLDLAAGIAGGQGGPDLGERDVDDVAQGILRVVGDPEPDGAVADGRTHSWSVVYFRSSGYIATLSTWPTRPLQSTGLTPEATAG